MKPFRFVLAKGLGLVQGLTWALLSLTASAQIKDAPLLDAARAEQPSVLKTLERMVNIETGTGDADGMKAMAALLRQEFEALGGSVSLHPAQEGRVGDLVMARFNGRGTAKILLIGHMDTVYVKGTLAKAPFRIEGERAYGPGIADDKGGLAVMIHAIKLLKARGFQDYGQLTVLINTDEERGSVGSRAMIQQQAALHDQVLSFEPTDAEHETMTRGTSGIIIVEAKIKGKASHAALSEAGVNALTEAADLILRTQDLDDKARGLRFNWTTAKAGEVRNIIPDDAVLQADVRFSRNEDLVELLKQLDERVAKKRLAGAQITISAPPGRPAFNAGVGGGKLIDLAQSIYAETGANMRVVDRSGGGTDAAYAALSGKPVIESLGLPGFGYHSNVGEYITLSAIPRRLYLTARMIMVLSTEK
jgi:glutamate carboxypeptidase